MKFDVRHKLRCTARCFKLGNGRNNQRKLSLFLFWYLNFWGKNVSGENV